MKFKLWGTRGSIASAGPDTVRYGGNTASVELRTSTGCVVILDAGSGIRTLGKELGSEQRIDILLSHLHMDHVQGLPFFGPLLDPEVEVHLWGPISTTHTLRERLSRYLSPPLFPIRVRELPNVVFHDVPPGEFSIDTLAITADLITHPGSTLGYRFAEDGSVLAYMPDHEPALGNPRFPGVSDWTSGYSLAKGADVLIHDAQYTEEEYSTRVGWGHTTFSQLGKYATMTEVSRLVTFHHDPAHSDDFLDEAHVALMSRADGYEVIAGKVGLEMSLLATD
ncbi:MAG: MBL fold metallo-hydrolase [Actinomycetota bacterium]|nr:MBL fold metallo-hydrolase [Actinomycetota bacterium]